MPGPVPRPRHAPGAHAVLGARRPGGPVSGGHSGLARSMAPRHLVGSWSWYRESLLLRHSHLRPQAVHPGRPILCAPADTTIASPSIAVPPRRSSQAREHTAGSSPCVRLPLPRTPLTKRDPTGEGRRAAPCGSALVNPTCFPRVSWSKRSMVTHGNYRRAWKGRYYGMLRPSSKTRKSNSDLHQHQKMHTSTNILRGCDTSS